MTEAKKLRGFAVMSKEKRREIARKGGHAVPKEKRSFSVNRALAQDAGRKGGSGVAAGDRSFSLDPELASRAGKRGGASRARKLRKQLELSLEG